VTPWRHESARGDELIEARGGDFEWAELGDGTAVRGDHGVFADAGAADGLGQCEAKFSHPKICGHKCTQSDLRAGVNPSRISAMNFAFTDEQEELRSTVRAFLDSKSSEEAVREQMETDNGFDTAVWSQMAEQMGLQGLHIPEEYGGSGFGYVELGIVLEEMGRSLLCAPFFSSVVLAANTLIHSGDEAAKKAHLPGIASGETIATLAYTEPSGKWDESGITMQASGSAGSYTLTGTKMYVIDGHTANLLIVAARTGAGVSLFAVDGNAAGLTRTALSTMDQTRKQAKIEFANTPATLIGAEGKGWDILSTVLDLAAVGLAAEQVGGAQKVLEMAVEYAKVRVQFGRPIGSFQAIKHKCADMLLEVESAKSAAYYGLWCASEMNEELPSVASLAKAYCSEAYFHATAENIQIHGGIGFTWEHPAHLYFKRAKSSELMFGDPTYHREQLAQRIGI
jgi:alkylation response protein AidB-like acyl-CoA dehydrogenase